MVTVIHVGLGQGGGAVDVDGVHVVALDAGRVPELQRARGAVAAHSS